MTDATLTEILNETEEETRGRQESQFDVACGRSGRPLILFGAGKLGRRILRDLRKLGTEPAAFTDNSAALWGRSVDGVPVLRPEDAASRFGVEGAFVVSIWNPHGNVQQVFDQLRQLGCRTVLPFVWLFWKHSSVFLPYYLWDAPSNIIRQAHEIRRAFGLFSDSESRRLLLSHVSLQLTGDFSVAPRPSASGRYFPEGLYEPSIAECFVDCGAYNGDTVREFTAWSRGQFRRIIAFEPDPVSFAALERCVFEDLKLGARVVTKRCATGRAAARVLFSASASEEAAVSNEGSLEVDCVTLDQALADERPTLIKMDIEGAELETIEGAQQVIRRDQPIMVVCLYHRQSDLWRIPLMIRELEPNSRLYLRQHEADGWELVCYSVPEWRLRRE